MYTRNLAYMWHYSKKMIWQYDRSVPRGWTWDKIIPLLGLHKSARQCGTMTVPVKAGVVWERSWCALEISIFNSTPFRIIHTGNYMDWLQISVGTLTLERPLLKHEFPPDSRPAKPPDGWWSRCTQSHLGRAQSRSLARSGQVSRYRPQGIRKTVSRVTRLRD